MLAPKFLAKYGKLPFRIGNKVIFSYSSGFLVPKNADFKSEMDFLMHWIVSSGIVDHIRRKYYPSQALSVVKEERVRKINIFSPYFSELCFCN
jgi:hypothetical protein